MLAELDRKNRALILSRLIVIAVESIKLHNFSGAVAIIGALQDPAIVRMKRTWSLIPPILMSEMENVRLCCFSFVFTTNFASFFINVTISTIVVLVLVIEMFIMFLFLMILL